MRMTKIKSHVSLGFLSLANFPLLYFFVLGKFLLQLINFLKQVFRLWQKKCLCRVIFDFMDFGICREIFDFMDVLEIAQ